MFLDDGRSVGMNECMSLSAWTPPLTRAVPDTALDCFHVHVGDHVFASHVDEHEARSIETVMNGIGPITAAARDVVHAAHMNPPEDVRLVDTITRLAQALERPAIFDE